MKGFQGQKVERDRLIEDLADEMDISDKVRVNRKVDFGKKEIEHLVTRSTTKGLDENEKNKESFTDKEGCKLNCKSIISNQFLSLFL